MAKLRDRLDARYTKICLYAGVTVVLTLAAAMLLYYSSGFFAKLWLLVSAVLEPAVYGAFIAYLLNPLAVRTSHAIERARWARGRPHLTRQAGVVVAVLGFLAVLAGVVAIMAIVITRSLDGLSIEKLGELFDGVREDVSRLARAAQGFLAGSRLTEGMAQSGGANLGAWLASFFQSARDVLSTLLFSTIFSIYILLDIERVGAYVVRVQRAVLGEKASYRVRALIADADRVFSGYIRGQFTDAVLVGLLSAIVLTLARVPYGPVVGLVTGMGNLIPYVGAPLGIATTVFVCAMEGEFAKMALGIVCLAFIMFVDSNVINPKLLSNSVEVHPLLVIGALIAGGAAGGVAGMLVAVPVAAFLKVQLDRWLAARERR